MRVWLLAGILLFISTVPVHSKTVSPTPPKSLPNAAKLENRMELVLEFNTIVAEVLDSLFSNEKPDLAILEWCEKGEMRSAGHPRIQQAYGELYISIKSCIRGEAKKARIAFQQAVWLMASEQYEIIESR